MDDYKKPEMSKELTGEEMVNLAFEKLLESYLSTRHRKKVDIITKAFNFARQAHNCNRSW